MKNSVIIMTNILTMKRIFLTTIAFMTIFLTNGQQTWEKIYNNKIANTFTLGHNNNYILAGAEYEAMFQKWNIFQGDSMGDVEWDTIFYNGLPGHPRCIEALPDSGYLIAGDNGGNAYFLRYNKNNKILWESNINSVNGYIEAINSITIANDSNYIVTGDIYSPNTGLFLAKINDQGDSIWTKKYFSDNYGSGISIVKSYDSGYYCLGSNTDAKILLLKINEQGDTLWTKTLDNSGFDVAKSLIRTMDSCFVISGATNNNQELMIMKINKDGDKLWTKTYGSNYPYNYCNSIAATLDSGYICANNMEPLPQNKFYPWIMKLDNNGDSIWSIKPSVELTLNKILQSKDSLYVFLANDKYNTPRLVKIDSTSGDIISNIKMNSSFDEKKIFNYPNPFADKTTIIWNDLSKDNEFVLRIMDSLGNKLFEKRINNENSFTFYMKDLQSGIYFYELKFNNKIYSGKMIKN